MSVRIRRSRLRTHRGRGEDSPEAGGTQHRPTAQGLLKGDGDLPHRRHERSGTPLHFRIHLVSKVILRQRALELVNSKQKNLNEFQEVSFLRFKYSKWVRIDLVDCKVHFLVATGITVAKTRNQMKKKFGKNLTAPLKSLRKRLMEKR